MITLNLEKCIYIYKDIAWRYPNENVDLLTCWLEYWTEIICCERSFKWKPHDDQSNTFTMICMYTKSHYFDNWYVTYLWTLINKQFLLLFSFFLLLSLRFNLIYFIPTNTYIPASRHDETSAVFVWYPNLHYNVCLALVDETYKRLLSPWRLDKQQFGIVSSTCIFMVCLDRQVSRDIQRSTHLQEKTAWLLSPYYRHACKYIRGFHKGL